MSGRRKPAAAATIAGVSDFVLALRLTIIAVLIVTLAVLGGRVNHWWGSRWRSLLPAAGTGAIAVCLGLAVTTAVLRDQPGGLSTVFTLAGAVAVLLQACTVGIGMTYDPDRRPSRR